MKKITKIGQSRVINGLVNYGGSDIISIFGLIRFFLNFEVACIFLLYESNFTPFGNLFGLLVLVFKQLLGITRRKPVLRIRLLKFSYYFYSTFRLCGQSLSSSFPLISLLSSSQVVEGERHYFMYASICYCKNENRKKTFTSNTSFSSKTWMIITGPKFKQGGEKNTVFSCTLQKLRGEIRVKRLGFFVEKVKIVWFFGFLCTAP